MRRIAVIGNGGGGKSTLAFALGQRLGIPVHEVDEVAHMLEAWAAETRGSSTGSAPGR
jgi:adenylate kinase family enzyme